MIRRCLVAILLIVGALLAAQNVAMAQPLDVTRTAIIGDSLTRGYGVQQSEAYATLMENRAPGDNILPLAYDGATVKRWNTIYKNDLLQLATWRPTTVVIALGGNDYYIARSTADYKAHLETLINLVREQVPNARVILLHYYQIQIKPNPLVCDIAPCVPAYPAPTWQQYGQAMYDTAVKMQAGMIDNSAYVTCKQYPLPSEIPTCVHMSYIGHQKFATNLYSMLYNF